MNNNDYIISQLGFAPSNPQLVEGALLDAGVTASATYAPGQPLVFKQVLLQVMRTLITTADTTFGSGETANSIKYDRPSILKRIAELQDELNTDTAGGPTIKAVSRW